MKIPFVPIAVLSFVAFGADGLAQQPAKPPKGGKKETPEKPPEKKPGEGKEISVTGEVVNLACPLFAAESPDAKHVCGPDCLKGGAWAGLIDDASGDLFVVVGKDQASAAARLGTWAGQHVTVKGKATEGKGLRALELEDVSKAQGAAKPAEASALKAREGTITGSVVNVLCALHPASNGEHHACDAKCLEGKQVLVGIRDDASGKIYVGFAPIDPKAGPKPAIETLRPLIGAKASVTGKIAGNLIEVTKAAKG
ncbi:MAG TPA: hypothetical protein VKF62_10230 [Planctomycetota bacterium]|nr:hypothetical protein [Planctomycetota bacterium]